MAPETLLFQTSPHGNIDAIVQHDGKCIFFFLHENPESIDQGQPKFGTRGVWVRNLQQGPLVINQDDLRQGIPTCIPRTATVDREGQPLLSSDELEVVWFEEGNAAALIQTRPQSDSGFETLAVIPPWSGREGFHGYAKGCSTETEVCWPMPPGGQLTRRIENARLFWQSINGPAHPFIELQKRQLDYFAERFSSLANSNALPADRRATYEPQYYSIDSGKFPPRGLIEYQNEDDYVLLTVGMALLPQPMVELAVENPSLRRRVELGIRIARSDADDATVPKLRNKLSQIAAYPWRSFSWFGHGHSCKFSQVFADRENAVLIDDRYVRPPDDPGMGSFRDDSIQLLWLVPTTDQQHQKIINGEVDRDTIHTLTAFNWGL